MTQTPAKAAPPRQPPRFLPSKDGVVQIETEHPDQLRDLFGTRTHDAASGLLNSAVNALGRPGEAYRPFIVAMAAEIEPRDAVEAMLVVQMTATHAAMTETARRMAEASGAPLREAYERSMTRLSRTHLAQMDALKKYRAKAQQTVRVERVTVHEGGQAIVGDVTHGGPQVGK